jgi:hypothetical protein
MAGIVLRLADFQHMVHAEDQLDWTVRRLRRHDHVRWHSHRDQDLRQHIGLRKNNKSNEKYSKIFLDFFIFRSR